MKAAWAMALLLAANAAQACGVCDEDKVAATYDYAVVSSATKIHHAVVFTGVTALDGAPAQLAAQVRQAAASLAGVEGASVRVSTAPGALSFAFDPAVVQAQALLRSLQDRLRAKGVHFRLIKVLGFQTRP